MPDIQKPFGAYAENPWQQKLLTAAQRLPANWLGRRGALLLRRLTLLSPTPVIDAVVEGLKFRLYMTDNVSERKFLFMPQFFDAYERTLLKKTLRAGDVFVDIGANAGIYSMTAAALVGEVGRVLAIEPNPVVLERLLFNAALNGFEKRVIAEQAGVSDRAGSFDLTLDDSNLGGSSLVASRSEKKISVACYPLLEFLRKHNITEIAALKIDIEGAEDRALMPFLTGAPDALRPQVIILENSLKDWKEDLTGALIGAGYVLFKKTRMNLVWKKV